MKLTRRQFSFGALFATFAVMIGLTGCDESVFNNILTYIGIGLHAFAVIVSLIPGIGPAISVAAGAVNKAFIAIQTAVNEYETAPAAGKTTLLGKIVTAINSAVDQLENFLMALPVLPAALDATITALVKLLVSTLEGFLTKLPGSVAPARTANLRGKRVGPVVRSLSEFKKEFNAELVTAGYPEKVLP